MSGGSAEREREIETETETENSKQTDVGFEPMKP